VDGKEIIEPATAKEYLDRKKNFIHKIEEDDICYRTFKEYGFNWGGNCWDNRQDYQHFEIPDEVIEKLYQLAFSGDLDASSNLVGRLHTTATY
jgi:hypothetical protein